MNNETSVSTAALQERIADLEQQLQLSDEGVSRLAQRCFALEQEVQTYIAALPKKENLSDSHALLQPVLYFNTGTGFSQKDMLVPPDFDIDEETGQVSASFELPEDAVGLRLDPGELPCGLMDLTFSDDRLVGHPSNGREFSNHTFLFDLPDPNLAICGLDLFPAGLKFTVSYSYAPLEKLDDQPVFAALLKALQKHIDKSELTKADEAAQLQQLTQQLNDAAAARQQSQQELAAQQQTIAALNQQIAELNRQNTAVTARCQEYETSLEGVLNSTSWKFTKPLRFLLGLFHR